MFNWDRVGLIVLFFIPALWQGQSANPTLFSQNLGDGCELFPILTAVLAHDALHRRVGFQSGSINRHSLAEQQSFLFQQAQYEHKYLVENRLRQTLPDHGHGSVHRGGFGDRDAQKTSQRQTVGTTPRDAALAVQTFEVTDEEHPKVNTRWDTGSAALLVIPCAELLDELVEPGFGQHLVEFGVEGVTGTSSQVGSGNEKFVLFGFAFSERHVNPTRRPRSCSIAQPTFLTGC